MSVSYYGIYYFNNGSWIGPYRPQTYLHRSRKMAVRDADYLSSYLKKATIVKKVWFVAECNGYTVLD